MTDIPMDIALGEGIRRLPVYVLLDCSGSMAGALIQAVQRGVELFLQEVRSDPFARETVHVGVITFDSDARMVTNGLVPIDQFQPPLFRHPEARRWARRCGCFASRWIRMFGQPSAGRRRGIGNHLSSSSPMASRPMIGTRRVKRFWSASSVRSSTSSPSAVDRTSTSKI